MTLDDLNRLIAPLRTRVQNMVSRAVVKLVNDGVKLQLVQLSLLEDETRDECERFQEYGFTSVPLEGAEAVVAFVGGRRDHPLVVAVDDRRYRMKGLQNGEVAIYTDEGDHIVIRRGGSIEIKAATEVIVDSPMTKLGGAGASDFVALASEVKAELADIRSRFDVHTHPIAGLVVTGTLPTGPVAATGTGTSAVPSAVMGPPGDVAATKAKAI
jgi:phage baseplate assembly protein V